MARAEEFSDCKSREEALSWFVKMNSGDVSVEDEEAHRSWLKTSEANRSEYAKLGAVWSNLDDVADPRNNYGPSNLEVIETNQISRRRFISVGAIAASLAVITTVALVSEFSTEQYSTSIGEQRNITLVDGSQIMMDAGTTLELKFTHNERRLHLLRGRAFFDVAKDKGRAFTVEANGGTATALGTRFTVHHWDEDVTVSVEEGTVAVFAPNSQNANVTMRQKVSYRENNLSAVRDYDEGTEAAWRNGKLLFEDQPLRQVVADLNRYRPGIIYIIDPALNKLRVSGLFEVNNVESALDAIRYSLPVQIKQFTPYVVLLSSMD